MRAKKWEGMDVEHVIFSVGQKEAMDAFQRTLELGSLAAHIVYFGDHMSATVFTSDTPRRLNASHRTAIEQAVIEAGSHRYIGLLEPVYASRVNRRLGRYLMDMAQGQFRQAKVLDYVPALITS